MATRLASADTADSVFVSQYDEGMDIDVLRDAVTRARISVLVQPPGTPSDQASVEAFRRHLEDHGLVPEFMGHIRADDGTTSGWKVALLRSPTPPRIQRAPPDFTVVAIMPAYNEADVIDEVIAHLAHNGVGAYLMDNWSTDDTLERALAYEGAGLVGYERFPRDGPTTSFELTRMLTRVEELALELHPDWVIQNDADEFRFAPWPGATLRDALFHVQSQGFSAVDHRCLNFALTEDRPYVDAPLEKYLTWFEVARIPDLTQLNCWRQPPGTRVELAWSGRHTVRFPGLRVFPYNFLMHHYPIRSVDQGRRKIFSERLPRFRVDERLQGWHSHYDHLSTGTLVRPTAGLMHLEPTFQEDFVLERLTGVGWEPSRGPVTLKARMARVLRRLGLLDKALTLRWRLSGRVAKS